VFLHQRRLAYVEARGQQVFDALRHLQSSEGEDTVVLLQEPGDLGWRRPRSLEAGEVIVSRPTGDGTALSDKHRDAVVEELRHELPDRRNADALEPICRLLGKELGSVADEHDGRIVADLDRSIDCKVEG
jgi:hypothetical protein